MASGIGSLVLGLLHSITEIGIPFRKQIISGYICLSVPSILILNCDTATKLFFSGSSKLIY
jgi:hypothetical protein